ncbi:MAG: DHH family phosphoesterase, partial [Clostridia bacterium]
MTDLYAEIVKRINKAKTVSIFCHTNPDGDTLCSALALYKALTAIGKSVAVFCDTKTPTKYCFLSDVEVITFPDKIVRDLSIAIDCSDIERLGSTMKSFLSSKSQIAIDHHKTHQKFADVSLVNAEASATGEIIYKLIKQMKLMTKDIAELLFAAIVTDCGCFSYSNTTEETHKIACDLLSYGFNASNIIYLVERRIFKNAFDLKNRVLSKCKFFEDDKVAILVFTLEDFKATNTESSDTEGIITNIINIDTVEVAYAVSEVGDKNYKVSIRT